MRQAPGFCGIILAAGESTRMGTDKALLPWPPGTTTGQTFLSGAIRALSLFSDMVIVVVGANEPNLTPIAYASGASVVRNPAPENGQFSSLRVGLQQALNYGRDAAIVTLVDRPPAGSATLEALTSAFVAAPNDVWAIVPEVNGKHGHPILLAREMIEAFLRAPDNANARDIEHQNQQHIQYIPVEDQTVTLNVNTPEDYATLTSAMPQSK
jgi:molybdenum cofactor cytidylyltransferase